MATVFTLVRRVLPYVAAMVAALVVAEWRPRAAGTISGVVFEDFNGNGVRDTGTSVPNASGLGTTALALDRGRAGITIRAFDSAGVIQGTAVSDASGAYALATGGTGPYRVEFTNLPAGYQSSAVAPGGQGHGSTVQFVTDGNTSGVNLGILDPLNFCRDNPTLITSCFLFGDNVSGPFSASPAIVSFPYSAGSNSPTDVGSYFVPQGHALGVPASRTGSVFGLAHAQGAPVIYAAAFMKKHAGFGPGGPGALYAINASTGAVSVFADLNAIFGAGTAGIDGHAGNGGDYARDNDNVAWDAVGKSAFGGLEISGDGTTLYVVNLADRHIYRLPTSGPLTTATVRRVSIPLTAPGATGIGGADLRPFALHWHRGQLYVGVVNSAESTQVAADLRGYVYRLDPATFTFGASPVFQFPLSYPRGHVQLLQPGGEAEWRPWSPTFATTSPGPAFITGIYPQPMLAGLSFDVDGHMVIGLRDRAGDQFGLYALDEPGSASLYEGMTGGDTLLATITTPGDLTSGWTLEANGVAGTRGPTGGANNAQGPGGGEYFFDDSFVSLQGRLVHEELTSGAVLQLPGVPEVVSSAFDAGLELRTGGFLWFRADNGARTKGYDLYFSPQPPAPPGGTFGKGNGLGELVALCTAAPLEIGNRVWDDVDGDGIQDPNESPLDNVVVELVGPAGGVLATTTTTTGGQYYFSSAPSGTAPGAVYGVSGLTANTAGFQVRIVLGQPGLGGKVLTAANADPSANGDSRDSDAVTLAGAAVVTFATGAAGANNHTLDFGFVSTGVALGDLVWEDTNDNGAVDPGESPLAGVDVRLFRDNGDGLFDLTTDVSLGGRTTDSAGLYRFSELSAGRYFVQIPDQSGAGQRLAGYRNSTGQQTGDGANNRDHGAAAPTPAQGIVSELVTLFPGSEPVTDGDADANTNLTIDFGFLRPVAGVLSLGNRVWIDYNNDGRLSPGEPGIDGFTVRLYDRTRTSLIASQRTANGGFYLFTGLAAGDYVVEVVRPSNYFYVDPADGRIRRDVLSSTAAGFELPAPPDPDTDTDSDDNGQDQGVDAASGGLVTRSLPVTLTPAGEPVTDGDDDANSNLTVDFGFFGVTAPDEPNPCISLQVPPVATPGGVLNFRIGTINQGPSPSGALVIDGMIPTGTRFVSAQPTAGGACALTGATVECVWPGTHPAGRQHWVDVSLQVESTVQHGQTIPLWFMSNNGTIPGGACMFDANVFVVSGGPTSDLVVTASVSAGGSSGRTAAALPGQPVQGSITVRNTGTVPAQGQYALLLDAAGAIDVTAASTNQGWVAPSSPSSAVFDTGVIAPGATAVLSVELVPRTTTAARVEIVRITGTPADPDARNDRADVVIDGIGGARSLALGNVFDSFAGGELMVGTGVGESPQVRVFNGRGDELTTPFYAFDRAFRGGVRLASCDIDANGLDEVIVAQGPGGGRVRVLSLAGGVQTEVAAFDAFEPGFTGGVNVACADTDADGRAEIVVGPDGGRAPDVRVYGISAGAAQLRTQFQAYDAGFTGGVRVAAARFPGSPVVGSFQVATMPGPGRAGDLRAWRVSGAAATLVAEATLVGSASGASVALGDTNADGVLDVLVAPDDSPSQLLRVFSLASGALLLDAAPGAGGFASVRPAVGVLTDALNQIQMVTAVVSGGAQAPSVATFVLGPAGAASFRSLRTGEVP